MAFTYSVIDSFSIVFLLILFFSTRERSNRLTETRVFRLIVLLVIVALLSDMLAWQMDGKAGATTSWLLWCANAVGYILTGVVPLIWLYYVGLKMNRLRCISKIGWLLIALPCVLLFALSISAPWTRLLFYIDSAGVYHRGPFIVLQLLIPLGYTVSAAIWTLHRAGKERLCQQRTEYLFLSSFILFPLLSGLLQLAVYGLSLVWPCTALSLMLVYVSMQNQRISLDALTGLNNRGQLDKHLFNSFERADNDLPFALFMLDIDEFKKINDAFGHIAGDVALVDAAGILKRSLAKSNAFLARYGGDEFAIVLHYASVDQIDALLDRIEQETQRYNEGNSGTASCRLVFSIGYASFDQRRYKHYQDMITVADTRMYQQKRLRKAQQKESAI